MDQTYYIRDENIKQSNPPARQSVSVNGVTLTRQQVEAAYKELNTPLPTPLPALVGGARVRVIGGHVGIVVGWEASRILRKAWNAESSEVIVFFPNEYGGIYRYPRTEVELLEGVSRS